MPLKSLIKPFFIAATLLPLLSYADSAQAQRIADANFQYCMQESLATKEYCHCVSSVYQRNLTDANLPQKEETFAVKALSGKLSLKQLSADEVEIANRIAKRFENAEFEKEFTQCFQILEDGFDEYRQNSEDKTPTEAQLKAIEELEAIEEMEVEEGI